MLANIFSNINKAGKYSSDTIDILRLIRSENVGPKTFFELIKIYGTAANALKNVADLSVKGGRKKPISVCSLKHIECELDKLSKINAVLVPYSSAQYPNLLNQIYDPPPILTCIGNLDLFNSKSFAIVGARNMSLHGKSFATNISKELVSRGITVVSGLARGIDTTAHTAALPKTIAVLAGGIDNIYPPENKMLYNKIKEHGLLVAELQVETPPLSHHFPRRNRIISGISYGTLVVEATMKSGSLITARFAIEQNREVFATPGFPMDPRSKGTNHLIKSGAHIAESIDDILENIIFQDDKLFNTALYENELNDSFKVDSYTITEQMRRDIVKLVNTYPVSVNELHNFTQMPIPIVNIIVLELELAGKVIRSSNSKIVINHNSNE